MYNFINKVSIPLRPFHYVVTPKFETWRETKFCKRVVTNTSFRKQNSVYVFVCLWYGFCPTSRQVSPTVSESTLCTSNVRLGTESRIVISWGQIRPMSSDDLVTEIFSFTSYGRSTFSTFLSITSGSPTLLISPFRNLPTLGLFSAVISLTYRIISPRAGVVISWWEELGNILDLWWVCVEGVGER